MTPLLGTKTPSAPVGAQAGWRQKSRPVAAFLRVVERHGAAMARHGRHGAPRAAVRAPSAPATGPFRFSRNTRHGFAWRAARGALWAGANSEVFTNHETRDTNHGLYAFPESRHLSPHGRCFPARCGATAAPLWRGYGAAVARVGRLWRWRGMGGDGAAWAAMAMERYGRRWSGMGGSGAAWAAYCPRASVPAPVSLSRSASEQTPLPQTPSEPMLKKENLLHGAISGAFHIASKPDLHFSPRGEAQCVRGPSGLACISHHVARRSG